MSSHIQLVEDGRLIGIDGTPWSATPVNAWSGFPCELHRHMRRGEVAHRHNPDPLVLLRYGARGTARIMSGSRVYELGIAPMQVDVFAAAFRMDHGSWDCTAGEVVSVSIHGALCAEDTLPPLRTTLCGGDDVLARIVDCMRDEIASGCPSGRLFADGLSLAIAARLRALHAERPQAVAPVGAMSDGLRRRIADYIDANLGADLRIASLATVVDLSPVHFVRLFRRTFGLTPHRYVTARRLERARSMLASTRSLESVAHALGFATQAHFTAAFRRRFGVTPGRSGSRP